MPKFKIVETQINNFNETHNKLQKFDEGLNIICGLNEAGKSTLMEFIKNVFVKKSSTGKGYVKCECDNEVFNLVSGDSKTIKSNDKYISNINSHEYQTGFIITLDDIMLSDKKDAQSLINTIKDSSGDRINTIEQRYDNYIHKKSKFVLTPTNNAGKDFDRQLNTLRSISDDILKIEQNENKYNSILSDIDLLDNELSVLNKQLEAFQTVLVKNKCLEDKQKISINPTLISKKSEFDELRQDFGGLKSLKEKENEIHSNMAKNKELLDDKIQSLNNLNVCEIKSVDEIKLKDEDISRGKYLIEQEKILNIEKNNIETRLKELKYDYDEKQFETESLKNKLIELQIEDVKKYQYDSNLLSGLAQKYSELTEKISNANINNRLEKAKQEDNYILTLIFGGIFFCTLATLILYWNSPVKTAIIPILLASFVGINTSLFYKFRKKPEEINYKSELNKISSDIIKLSGKLGYKFDNGENFIIKTNAFISEINEKIKTYKYLDENFLKEMSSLDRCNNEIKLKENELNNILEKLEGINKEKEEFLSKISFRSLDNFEEACNFITNIESISSKLLSLNDELKNIDSKTEEFAKGINDFVKECKLDNIMGLNKYDYEKFDDTLNAISELLYNNIQDNTTLTDLENKISDYENILQAYGMENISENIKQEDIEELKSTIDLKINEKGMLLQQKSDIENVENLIDLKNKKNTELNSIGLELSKLAEKEIMLELIRYAKDEFNSIQPNLICAKEYLKKITDGKYDEIDFEAKTISGPNTGDKEWEKLSRGTKEQLYLALRLGYAYNYSKDIDGNHNGQPNLPIIIDDAFVNFDKIRTTAILKCLSDFAENNQVLYFTCHTDSVKEILKKEKIKYNLIEME